MNLSSSFLYIPEIRFLIQLSVFQDWWGMPGICSRNMWSYFWSLSNYLVLPFAYSWPISTWICFSCPWAIWVLAYLLQGFGQGFQYHLPDLVLIDWLLCVYSCYVFLHPVHSLAEHTYEAVVYMREIWSPESSLRDVKVGAVWSLNFWCYQSLLISRIWNTHSDLLNTYLCDT